MKTNVKCMLYRLGLCAWFVSSHSHLIHQAFHTTTTRQCRWLCVLSSVRAYVLSPSHVKQKRAGHLSKTWSWGLQWFAPQTRIAVWRPMQFCRRRGLTSAHTELDLTSSFLGPPRKSLTFTSLGRRTSWCMMSYTGKILICKWTFVVYTVMKAPRRK